MVGTQVASLYASMGADISGFTRGMGTVDNMLHASSNKLGGFVNMLGTGLVVAGTAAAAGLAVAGAGIVNVTNKAATAQQAVADIAANMQLSADETQKVAKLVNDLGIDPKLKVTATEAAAAIDMLGKNGQSLSQIFDGSARATVLLANSTKADFSTAADIATDVMLQFNIAAGDMMDAVNGITGVTQYSKFGINDYKLALAQAGGVASSVGVNFDDFNATIAAISPLFAGGSDAGTSFKVFLQQLTPSTKPAIAAMKELGLLTESGSNQFYDATGNMKSMAEVSGLLKNAFAGLSDEQKNQYASTIFGTDAMRTAFALANAGADTINKLKQQIGNVDAEKAAATRMDTLSGDYEIFMGVVDALSIRIGEKFIPAARDMLKWATNMASGNADRIVDFFSKLTEYIPEVTKRGVDLFNLVTGPGVTKTVKTLAGAFFSLGRTLALLARPFKEAFGGLFSELSAANSTGFTGIFDSIVRRIGKAIGDFGKLINEQAIPFVLGKLGELAQGIYEWAKSVDWGTKIKEAAVGLWEWAKGLWGAVSPYLASFWNELTSWATDENKRAQLWNGITGAVSALWEWAKGLWSAVSPYLESFWTELISWVADENKREILGEYMNDFRIKFIDWAEDMWKGEDGMARGMVGWWSAFENWMGQTFPEVKKPLGELRSNFITLFDNLAILFGISRDDLNKPWNEIWTSLMGESGSASKAFSSFAANVIQLAADITLGLANFVGWLKALLNGDWNTVWNGIKNTAVGVWTFLKNNFNFNGPDSQAIIGGVKYVVDGIKGWLGGLKTYIKDDFGWMIENHWPALWTKFKDKAVEAVQGMKDRLGEIMSGLGEAWEGWIVAPFKRAANRMVGSINALIGSMSSATMGFAPSIPSISLPFPGYAAGGMFTAGGKAIVGERGPEIVDLPGGSYVHNNRDSVDMLSGGSSRLDIYIHGESAIPRDRAALRELAEMLRKEIAMTGARLVYS